MGLRSGRGASRLWVAHFFLPYVDLSRARADEYRARPRTPGNIRSGNRAEIKDQAEEWRADFSYIGAFLAGVSGAGDDPRRVLFRFRDVGIADRVLCIPDSRSCDRDAFHPGHAALSNDWAMAAAVVAFYSCSDVAGVAGARFSGGCGVAGAYFGTRAGDDARTTDRGTHRGAGGCGGGRGNYRRSEERRVGKECRS